jgi:hypothetical protein
MHRRTVIATLSLAILALPATASAATSLTIRVYDRPIPAPPAHVYHLHCAPASGTVPHPVLACRRLFAATRPFAVLRECDTVDVITARVTGTFRGQTVDRAYLPCGPHMTAWKRLAALLGIPIR